MKKTLVAVCAAMLLVLAGCASGQSSSSSASGSASSSSAQSAQAESSSASSAPASPSEQAPQSEASAASASSASPSEQAAQSEASSASVTAITIQINDVSMSMELADTEAASALVDLLREGPVSVSLHAYGGFEQVGALPQALPTSDEQITTVAGDVMLYQGDQITIFYGSNTWEYTPLGHIQDATTESLLEAFGEGDATIQLSL